MNIDNERVKNILRSVQVIALILVAYFLGMNATIWTNAQIKEYCFDYNNYSCSKCFGYGSNFNTSLQNISFVFNMTN